MMDWPRFFSEYGITSVDRGHGVGKNQIGIRCPFCTDDEGYHMSVSLEGKGWRCWRNPTQHFGRSPVGLICQLIGCSFEEGRRLAGGGTVLADGSAKLAEMKLAFNDEDYEVPQARALTLTMPDEFRQFEGKRSSVPYVNYLLGRDIHELEAIKYGLRYATHGEQRGRIIFPIYYHDTLVSWTGRSISDREPLRYKECSQELAGVKAKDYLLWYDMLMRTKCPTLVITEGPFDALKVNVLGEWRARATCCFGIWPTDRQIDLMHTMLPRFARCLILLDRAAEAMALRLQAALMPFRTTIARLPDHVKDPGELSRGQLLDIIHGLEVRA